MATDGLGQTPVDAIVQPAMDRAIGSSAPVESLVEADERVDQLFDGPAPQ